MQVRAFERYIPLYNQSSLQPCCFDTCLFIGLFISFSSITFDNTILYTMLPSFAFTCVIFFKQLKCICM